MNVDFAIVLLGPSIKGDESGGSINELWLQVIIKDFPLSKCCSPLITNLQPMINSHRRIHFRAILIYRPCPWGSGNRPVNSEGSKMIKKLTTNVYNAHKAHILPKRLFRNFILN